MSREYHACKFRYSGRDRYLLWYSNDPDGVHVDSCGFSPTFEDVEHLKNYAKIHDLAPITIDDPILHDLDYADRFTREPLSFHIDCKEVLRSWNLFGDFAHSFESSGASFLEFDKTLNKIYDKIFHGCNIPVITPKGKEYFPAWTHHEIRSIQELLKIGLFLFRSTMIPILKSTEEAE